MIIVVSLKTDDPGGGSAKLACNAIAPDPLLSSTHVQLQGVTGLSWPFSGAWVNVKTWSVPKDAILNYMVGPITSQPAMTVEALQPGGAEIPHLPGTLPSEDLNNDTTSMEKLIKDGDDAARQEELANQAAEAMAQKQAADEEKAEAASK